MSQSSEEREQSKHHIPFNHADTSGFCKGVHSCGSGVNRKLTVGAKTRGIMKLSKYLEELILFSSENYQRDKCSLGNRNEIRMLNILQFNKYLLSAYSFS